MNLHDKCKRYPQKDRPGGDIEEPYSYDQQGLHKTQRRYRFSRDSRSLAGPPSSPAPSDRGCCLPATPRTAQLAIAVQRLLNARLVEIVYFGRKIADKILGSYRFITAVILNCVIASIYSDGVLLDCKKVIARVK